MRIGLALLALLALAACETAIPSDGAPAERLQTATEDTTALAAASDDAATDSEQQVVIKTDNPGISNTQDFTALTETVTIEEDKERLKALRENFKQIDPTPLPSRPDPEEVNVVSYALNTTNQVGEQLYRRVNPLGATLAKRACARYRLADDAQEAFLKAGGPRRDPKNLDPDGDGFACGWSPDKYRKFLKQDG